MTFEFRKSIPNVVMEHPEDHVPPSNPNHLTIHQLRACAPLSLRKAITPNIVKLVNSEIDDSEAHEEFRDHVVSWIDVMQYGKWKIKDYVNACKYVTHKLLGSTQQSSWVKTFPDRYQRMVDNGSSDKQISSAVSLYNRGDLVIRITERTLPPIHILNSDLLQEAINVQAHLMRHAKSETVRMKASATLIENLKAPESVKVDLNVGVSNDTLEDLRQITRGLAVEQKKMIESGAMSPRQIAEMSVIRKKDEEVIEAEFEEMTPDKPTVQNTIKDFFPGSK